MKAVIVTRRRIAAAAVALAVPVLTSCGGNFNAPTEQVYTPGVGVNDRSGSVDVLHALIVTGEDGSGTVIGRFVNNDEQNPDALTSITGAGDDASIGVEAGGSQVEIPADGSYQLADEGNVSVTGDQIKPGNFITLTFAFERAQSATLDVPVVSADDETYADVPLPE